MGFSGTGKTERVVRPLLSHAHAELHVPAVHIDVPAQPTQLDQEMLARLVEALREAGREELADEAAHAPNFTEGARRLLRQGGLVVVDEFQRLLHADHALPVDPYADKLRRLGTRASDGGCLWLVSNRSVDPDWSEPFHTAFLEPPGDIADVIDIVTEALGTADAASRVPEARHEEIAQRFGRNPRALRLLGHLMRHHALDELIGPPQAAAEGLSLEDLAERIERSLLMRAREGLSNAAAEFLRDLSILPEPASMGLLEAFGAHLGKVPLLLGELQERFLVDQRRALRQVHPLVREVEVPRLARDPEASGAAHRRAGAWHAAALGRAVDRRDDAAITTTLGGVRHHFTAAGAREELVAALDVARPYVERKFNWTASHPSTEAERGAQIALLELFLAEPGAPSAEFQLARRLEMRGEDGDLIRALDHAARATKGYDEASPWVLRLRLAYQVQGPEAAVSLGPEAIATVDPGKNLYSVYQVYAGVLNILGRDDEAIASLYEGVRATPVHSRARLTELALAIASAMPEQERLEEARVWRKDAGDLAPQVMLAEVLLDQRASDWKSGAERARIARRQFGTYLHLALQEAFCWLAAGDPEEAQRALDRYPRGFRLETRTAATWLAALVACRTGDLVRGHGLAETYLGGPLPADVTAIERALIREWDTRVATLGEANPALIFPILPSTLSGLPHSVLRPQHGPPVLPQRAPGAQDAAAAPEAEMHILAVGTEWASGHGGLSTFNRQLCIALARTGADVTCLAIAPSAAEIDEAAKLGVRLVAARATPGEDERQWLSRRPPDLNAAYRPTIVIGHGRITGPAAARLADDVFPGAQRLHFVHMAPDEIEWHKFDRDNRSEDAVPAAVLADKRTQVELDLAKGATRTVAVGPRLYHRFLRDLSPYECPAPLRFDPGFDPLSEEAREPPPGTPLKVLLLGRAEDEKLKGLDIAARAVGKVATRFRSVGLPDVELVVRGAKPEDAGALRKKMREWAGVPLEITPRPFTTDDVTLRMDMLSSSVVLMPSRSEGFGLVGLEAIVAGTPVLVTSRSGLAEMLQEKLGKEVVARIMVPTTGDDRETEMDSAEWAQAIEAVLKDRNSAFRNARDLAKRLGSRTTWANAVEQLLSDFIRR
ncbi:glycosyltransferase [Cereibacter sphaeroides]|uniref:glycosyltransferase n=1 Tax=Cereibacter sphaeroides TaxID=1063 RepID=UPI003FCE3AB1